MVCQLIGILMSKDYSMEDKSKIFNPILRFDTRARYSHNAGIRYTQHDLESRMMAECNLHFKEGEYGEPENETLIMTYFNPKNSSIITKTRKYFKTGKMIAHCIIQLSCSTSDTATLDLMRNFYLEEGYREVERYSTP